MSQAIDMHAVAALGDEPVDWRFKGLPASWQGRSCAEICTERPHLVEDGPSGPLCVLDAAAVQHNLATMARWCDSAGVALAPHGKTHMAPQLVARQLHAGACEISAATISQVRTYRAFGVRDVILANELVDASGLRWLAGELDNNPEFGFVCWVDSVPGVHLMATELATAGARRPVDVCVEVGMAGGRTGCRTIAQAEEVARAAARCPQLRLAGVSGYEAALGHDVTADAMADVRGYVTHMCAVALRLSALFEVEEIVVSAGGSTYFDVVAEVLTGAWSAGLRVRPVIRSGAYLVHDHGLYQRTSPLTRDGLAAGLQPAMSIWAQVTSMPEPGVAVLTMGRRDASFDQDLPIPLDLAGSRVVKLNDQHAYLRLDPGDEHHVQIGTWLRFGISHPCTTFDKWQLIPMLDAQGRVVDLIRTFF